MEIIHQYIAEWSAALRRQTILLFFCPLFALAAPEPPDTLHTLGQVEVEAARRSRPRIAADGSVTFDASMLDMSPRYFGEADMTRLMLTTAGVTTISSYSSGASIDGMDYSQNLYLLNGITVEFPYHFGGIFSTFNATHYPRLRLYKSHHPSGMPDCLGGIIDIEGHSDTPQRFCGTVNAGMTASSATLRMPVGRVSIEASGRVSYIDALYKPLLDSDDTGISYRFHDLDIAATWRPDALNRFGLFGHLNSDRMGYDDSNFAMDTRMRWVNALAGVSWQGPVTEALAGFSRLSNRLTLDMPNMSLVMPSSINRFFAGASHRFYIGNIPMRAGARATAVDARLQSVGLSGFGSDDTTPSDTAKRRAVFTKLWAEATISLPASMQLEAGFDVNAFFGDDGFRRMHFDPRLALTWRNRTTTVSIRLGRYHQYVHTVGFSEIGMASNFKLPATRQCPPQQSLAASIAFGRLIEPLALKINADIYYKRVFDQPEYTGGVIDLLQPGYCAEDYISVCSGYNTGGSITLTRDFSRLTASASYALAIARRRMPGSCEWFTASSEIRNSINLSASYRFPGNHWSVSASWAYATGRPVTPVRAVYFIAERLMVEYGSRNASNLPAYHRLDLSAFYRFTTPSLTHTLSLAIINAYGRRNIEISTYAFNADTGTLRQRNVSSLYRFIPSISYTIEF